MANVGITLVQNYHFVINFREQIPHSNLVIKMNVRGTHTLQGRRSIKTDVFMSLLLDMF